MRWGRLGVDLGGLPIEEGGLQLLGDRAWRGEGEGADLGDGVNVAGGGGEKHFVGVTVAEEIGGQVFFFDVETLLLGQLDDEGAGDAGEAAAAEWWCEETVLGDEKEVAAGAFAEVIVLIGEEALAASLGFGGGEGADVVGVGGGFDPC